MAEGGKDTDGSWWGGWLEAAKEKSALAVEFMKKDLTEFACAVQTDTAKLAEDVKGKLTQENASVATQKVKEGVSCFLGGISRALVIEAEDKDTIGTRIQVEPIFDRSKARLRAIQIDPSTYLNEPVGSTVNYEEWLKTFELENLKGGISELLVVNVEVRGLYTQLVPSQVSHADFWSRYFYRVHQLELDEARRAALMKRADDVHEQKDLAWDDESSDLDPAIPNVGVQNQITNSQLDKDDWGDIGGPTSPTASRGIEIATAALEAQEINRQSVDDSLNNSTRLEPSLNQTDTSISDRLEDENIRTGDSASGNGHVALEEKPIHSIETIATAETSLGTMETKPADLVPSVKPGVEPIVTVTAPSNDEKESSQMRVIKSPEIKCSSENTTDIDTSGADGMQQLRGSEGGKVTEVVKTAETGDLAAGGSASDRTTPSSDLHSSNKESSSLDDDWEKDFDIDVTEEDIRAAQEATKNLNLPDDADDWENWD